MDLCFHLIFTPGTARLLSLFTFSLLRRLPCSFRLVANGCTPADRRFLERLCARYPDRLDLVVLPFGQVVNHGEALTYLQPLESADYFCFMDTDILATGDFVADFVPHLGQGAGLFGGTPLWCRDDEQILPPDQPFVGGRYSYTQDGLYLGTTFLAIYDNHVLARSLEATGVSFRMATWNDVPLAWRPGLESRGLCKKTYDTGKLLNLLLHVQGQRLVHVESPHVHHVGGLSPYTGHRRISNLGNRIRYRVNRLFRPPAANPSPVIVRAKRRRDHLDRYFSASLRAIWARRQPPPVPDLGEPDIQARAEAIVYHLVALDAELRAEGWR